MFKTTFGSFPCSILMGSTKVHHRSVRENLLWQKNPVVSSLPWNALKLKRQANPFPDTRQQRTRQKRQVAWKKRSTIQIFRNTLSIAKLSNL